MCRSVCNNDKVDLGISQGVKGEVGFDGNDGTPGEKGDKGDIGLIGPFGKAVYSYIMKSELQY